MESPTPPVPVSKKALWTGYVMSALPALLLVFSAVMKLLKPPAVVDGFAQMGWPVDLVLIIGGLELICTIIYLIPRTAILGAILLTGYLGGALATHVRLGEPWYTIAILGVLLWGGLYLRDPRLRALLPLRR